MTVQNFQFNKNLKTGTAGVRLGLGSETGYAKAGKKKTKKANRSTEALFKKAMKMIVAGDLNKARSIVDEALSYSPKNINLLRLSGDVYLQQQNLDQALLAYMDAMGIDPFNTSVLNSIGSLLLIMKNQKDANGFFLAAHQTDRKDAYAAYNWVHTSMHLSDWGFFEKLNDILRLGDDTPLNVQPFTLLAISDDPGLHKLRVKARCKILSDAVKENRKFVRSSVVGRKIRIGFFSGDFYSHATMLLLGDFFELLDKDRFEVVIYDFGPITDDEHQQKVKNSAYIYRRVKELSEHELVQLSREDCLDIAVDMKGYTRNGRMAVFAERAAPVQVAYLGYPGTSGLGPVDYFVADEVTVPQSQRQHFSEKIMYMPDCYQPNDRNRKQPDVVPSRTELGLPEGKFIFCSLNNPNKVTPAEFDVWMKLLCNVPESVLWILAPNEEIKNNLTREANARGVGGERLIFAERVSMDDHLARMRQADLFLDAFNCNAHTTASEAVWAGVPLVTKAGNQFAARVAASVVTAIGCPDLVTETIDEYYDLAYKLATEADTYSELRLRLQDNLLTTPLYDSESYARNFEKLMEMAILRYEEGAKPKHLMVREKTSTS
ncbi:TPR repeat protein [Roseobacter sp. SK209-2-6]|nr:TPR repeat protein [Roseobacter sp. SK209-2-6]